MPYAEATATIRRSPAEVFELLLDTARAPEWMESCVSLGPVTPGPLAPGARLHYAYRQGSQPGSMEGEVTALVPASTLAMRLRDPKFTVEVQLRLSPTADGVQVQHGIDIIPGSLFGRLMSPLIQMGNRRQVVRNLERLKRLAEGGQAT